MASLTWSPKDPDEVMDYDLDWSKRLDDSDTIASATWHVDAGTVVIGLMPYTTTVAKVWLSGGVDGEDADVRCTISTAGGRTMEQTVRLKIRSR